MPVKKPIKPASSRTAKPSTPTSRVKPVARALTGLSLRQLLKATPPYIQANAQEVIIRELKPAVSRGGFPGVKSKILSVGNRGTKHQYRATIVGKETDIPLYKQKHVIVSCECVTGDTRVLTSEGWKTIYDIAEPFTGALSMKYVVNGREYKGTAPYYKGKQPVWKISAGNGRTITATKDHPFLVFDGYKKVWRKLKDLQVGDRLVLDEFEIPEIEFNRNFYEGLFLGALMGDGTVNGTHHADLQLYGYKHALVDYIAEAGVIADVKESARDGLRLTFNNRAIELIHKHDFDNKIGVDLKTPEHVFGYLSGLLSTDGVITKQIHVTGAFGYLSQLQEYLFALGLGRTSLTLAAQKGDTTNCGVRSRDLYYLRIHVADLERLSRNLVMPESRWAKVDEILERKRRVSLPGSRILSIAYSGKKHVYDITVPKVSMFNANGFIVHNCDFFLYYCEYALTHWGSAVIKYSNGEPPVHTNPGLLPLMCKHLTQLAKTVITHKM